MTGFLCPECHEPVREVSRSATRIPIALHRDSSGRKCPASGRNLVHYRWQSLLRVVFGQDTNLRGLEDGE